MSNSFITINPHICHGKPCIKGTRILISSILSQLAAGYDFEKIKKALEDASVPIEVSEITMVPQTYVKLEGKEAQQMLRLVETLEDNDDVQNVYANFDIPEEIMLCGGTTQSSSPRMGCTPADWQAA